MASFTHRPALLVPGVSARITFVPTDGTLLRVWVTDAPLGSEFKRLLDEAPDRRVLITSLKQVARGYRWSYTFDKGGKYLLTIQEYRRASGFGGGYSDDPDASPKEETVGVPDSSLSIVVCQRLEQRVGAGSDSATLVVYVNNTDIVQTDKKAHGENTPALINSSGARVTTAINSTAVQAALSALVDTSASTSLGMLTSVYGSVRSNFNAHLTESGVHGVDDTNHSVSSAFSNPDSPKALEQAVTELAKQMRLHFENQDADQYGVGTDSYHNSADWENILVALPTGNTAGVVTALANLHLSFEAHRANNVLHQLADFVNDASDLPPLLALHSAFINELRQTNPATPAVSTQAAITLIHGGGFEEKQKET